MSHQDPGAARGWLPTLDANQRFRSGPPTAESTVDAEPAAEAAPPRSERIVSQDWSTALETQFGLRTSEPSATARQQPVEVRQDSMAELKDRLAYYEHFDQLIKDNISRSAELFQAVFAEREKAKSVQTDAEAMMNAVSAEAERRVGAERQHMLHILTALMDEATFLQQRSDSLVQRVAEAITEMTAFRDEEDEPVSGA